MTVKTLSRSLFVFLMLILVGCVSTPPTHYYTLDADETIQPGIRRATGENPVVIGIGPVRFPEYLSRSHMVIQEGDTRVGINQFHRWVEPLRENFTRIFIQDLTMLLPDRMVIEFPWGKMLTPRYRIPMHVLRFEGPITGPVELTVQWSVNEPGKGDVAAWRESAFQATVNGQGHTAWVQALSRALGDFSREVATTLEGLAE